MELTNYELLDLVASWKADTAFGLTSLMSVITAYILVAYFVGARLTRAQVIVVSGLMLWFSTIGIMQLSVNLRTLIEFNIVDVENYGAPADVVTWAKSARYVTVIGSLCAVLASLYFMWSVRHTKTE